MAQGRKSLWPTRRITRWITKHSAVKRGPMPRGAAGETGGQCSTGGHHASTDGSARRTSSLWHCKEIGRKLRLL